MDYISSLPNLSHLYSMPGSSQQEATPPILNAAYYRAAPQNSSPERPTSRADSFTASMRGAILCQRCGLRFESHEELGGHMVQHGSYRMREA